MNSHCTRIFFYILLFFSTYQLKAAPPKICLNMIVKNEESIIERCLESVKDIVDCISICDTGSTDNTVEKIERFLQATGIPGRVYQHEWRNFGYNRTLSFHAAQNTIEACHFPLDDFFLLLLDADMILQIDGNFNKEEILSDSYQVAQKDAYVVYYNTRLIRASLPWECVGVTHEYWSCRQPCTESRLETLRIDDRNDGGSKRDKFERDIRLLTQGLKDEPSNERYLFYLAQSYKCIGDYKNAIFWYEKRISKGGWFEEIWYSIYMIGECYQEQGDWDQALTYYFKAYEFNPDRAEPLESIATYYRHIEAYNLAYLFAKEGAKIPFPSSQSLFISYPVYEYLFDEILSIASYYTSDKEEGYAANNRLLLKKSVPQHIKEQAYKNILFYIPTLPNAIYQPIEFDLPFIRKGLSTRYNPMNPSIKKTDEGFDLICRTVNYTHINATNFHSLDLFDPTNTIITKNFLLKYDKDLHLLSQQEILDNITSKRSSNVNVQGLEDCRIFAFNDSNWFTCTTYDTHDNPMPQVSLCKLADKTSSDTIEVEKLFPLFGPDPNRCEKNWLPLVKDNELYIIYYYDPLIIFKTDISGDSCKLSYAPTQNSPQYDFSRFAGSASPVPFENGFLLLIHETIFTHRRIYSHRFVYLDLDFKITKLSKPFIFLHQGIEYCCGVAVNHSETKLIMSIGIEDREAYTCTIDLDTVRSLLDPL